VLQTITVGRQRGKPHQSCRIVAGYAIPNELRTFEDYERRQHLDLARLDRFALWSERKRVEWALARSEEGPERSWLRERRAAVLSEKRARRSRWLTGYL